MKIIVTEGALLEKAVWGGEECRGQGREGFPKGPEEIHGDMHMFIILTVLMVSPSYTCENILFYFKYVQSIAGLLCFNQVFVRSDF